MNLAWVYDGDKCLMRGQCRELQEAGLHMALYFIGRPVLVLLDQEPRAAVPAEADCLLYMQAQSNCKVGLATLMQAGQVWLEHGRQPA